MVAITVSNIFETPSGWATKLTKDWYWSDETIAWFKLAKILRKHHDADWQSWTRIGTHTMSHDVSLGHDRHEADLHRQVLVGDLEHSGFDVKEEKKMARSPYREGIALIKSVISEVLNETRDDYIVRGGSEILVRGVDEPKNSWRWETFPKVLYFGKEQLVRKPRGPTDLQNYVFKKNNMLYAVDSRRLYASPD